MKIAQQFKTFWSCLGFLSIVPAGRDYILSPEEFGRFPAFYPLVGFVFGLDMFILWLLTAAVVPPRAAALAVVVFLIIVNRGFHIDGLADAADALLSHKSHEDKLRILKDSRQGTFGVLAIVFDVLIKVEFVALVAPEAPWMLIMWPVWGRLAASISAVRGDYAGQDNGLGRWMVEKSTTRELFYAGLFTLAVSAFGSWMGLFAALSAIMSGFILVQIWKNSLGGVTGDLLGASIELTEIVTIVIFYILISLT